MDCYFENNFARGSTDEYTLFYLTWIEPIVRTRLNTETATRYWEEATQTWSWKAWAGYAFESVCYKHIANIRQALKISAGTPASSWRYIAPYRSKLPGTQIDLVFERHDGLIHICEIKHAKDLFKIDKEYATVLENKRRIYQEATKTTKQVVISMITTFGLKPSDYANELIFSSCTLGDLFK